MKFAVGDRVRVYRMFADIPECPAATVIEVWSDALLLVEVDWYFDGGCEKVYEKRWPQLVHKKQCRKLKQRKSTELQVGDEVQVTAEGAAVYRSLVLDSFDALSTYPKDLDYLKDRLMWAMSDLVPPTGEVIQGNPAASETNVMVRLSSHLGSTECYFAKRYLRRIK